MPSVFAVRPILPSIGETIRVWRRSSSASASAAFAASRLASSSSFAARAASKSARGAISFSASFRLRSNVSVASSSFAFVSAICAVWLLTSATKRVSSRRYSTGLSPVLEMATEPSRGLSRFSSIFPWLATRITCHHPDRSSNSICRSPCLFEAASSTVADEEPA